MRCKLSLLKELRESKINQTLKQMKVIIFMAIYFSQAASVGGLKYPETQRIDHEDIYHGVKVEDPYQWLEKDVRQSEQVRDWVKAQNEVTYEYLKYLPKREQIRKRITELWDYEKYSVPSKVGGRYFISRNDGLQNHSVVYVMDSLDSEKRVLFNPNKWSEDGTMALGGLVVSDDGKLAAYGIQESGSDWRTWKVRNIDTGQDLADTLKYLKFTDVTWDHESRGFFYSKYPDPDPNEQFISLNQEMKVMYHTLGTSQEDDVVVYYRPDHPEWGYDTKVTDDGRYLILTIWTGTDNKYRIMYKDLNRPFAMPVDLIENFDNEYSFIDNDGPIFFFGTDFKAPNRRVIAIDIRKPGRDNWVQIIPESKEPLQSVDIINNLLVCSYLKDVTTRVKLFTLEGKYLRDIEFPGLGTSSGFIGKRRYTETFYSFEILRGTAVDLSLRYGNGAVTAYRAGKCRL